MTRMRLSIFAAALALASVASAQVAYNNYGAGDTYDQNSSEDIGGPGNFIWAMQFTSATSGAVSAITMPLFPGYWYDISINVDNGGLPGSPLETWYDVYDPGPPNVSVSGDGSATLSAGAQYWVAIAPHFPFTMGGGWYNSLSASGLMAEQGYNLGEWSPRQGRLAAFRVETVPEPTAMAALGIGALAFLARRRSGD